MILETNRNKPWFNEECSEFANKRKQTKLLFLQNPNNQTAEDFSNVRRDTCRIFRKKKRNYMKAKVNPFSPGIECPSDGDLNTFSPRGDKVRYKMPYLEKESRQKYNNFG